MMKTLSGKFLSRRITLTAEATRVYTFKELPEDVQERLIENERNIRANDYDIPWCDEVFDSLKALVKATGYTIKDYEISQEAYRSYIRIDELPCDELTGKRALAWLENQVLSPLRIPFNGARRWELAKYGAYYRAGMVNPCPFTGACFDEDLLDALRKDLVSGTSVREAVEGLADTAAHLIESQIEDYCSEESARDSLENEEKEYDVHGNEL